MKVVFEILGIAVLGYLLHQFLPWWIIVIAAGIIGLMNKRKGRVNFLIGFAGAALLWLITAGIIDWQNGSILSDRIGQLFGGLEGYILVILTGLLGGILGGLGAMTGSHARQMFG